MKFDVGAAIRDGLGNVLVVGVFGTSTFKTLNEPVSLNFILVFRKNQKPKHIHFGELFRFGFRVFVVIHGPNEIFNKRVMDSWITTRCTIYLIWIVFFSMFRGNAKNPNKPVVPKLGLKRQLGDLVWYVGCLLSNNHFFNRRLAIHIHG